MNLIATVTSKEMQKLRARWKLEGGIAVVPGQRAISQQNAAPVVELSTLEELTWPKEGFVLRAPGDDRSALPDGHAYAGAMFVYDWSTKEVVWESDWGDRLITPHGFVLADGVVYVADLEAANIFKVSLSEPGKLLSRISHPALNDIHGIARTKRGLLVSNCGTDCLIELDFAGNSLWEWWAGDHGMTLTPSGLTREAGRGGEHRNRYYHTRYQVTHVNNVDCYGPNDEYVLATLFHQGMIVRIDRTNPRARQRAEIVLAGLARPHGPIPYSGGWLVCNSLGKEIVTLDPELDVVERIPYDGGWIQDATELSNGHILLNDVDNHVLVELAGPDWHEAERVPYDHSWRMAEIRELPDGWPSVTSH
jgi:hypothetical protein